MKKEKQQVVERGSDAYRESISGLESTTVLNASHIQEMRRIHNAIDTTQSVVECSEL
jgi:hypothetical protein